MWVVGAVFFREKSMQRFLFLFIFVGLLFGLGGHWEGFGMGSMEMEVSGCEGSVCLSGAGMDGGMDCLVHCLSTADTEAPVAIPLILNFFSTVLAIAIVWSLVIGRQGGSSQYGSLFFQKLFLRRCLATVIIRS